MGWPKMPDSPRVHSKGFLSELTSVCRMDLMAISGGICDIYYYFIIIILQVVSQTSHT